MKQESNFLYNVSSFIVYKRNLFFFIFTLLCIFSVFSMNWVNVEDDLTAYLDENTQTRIGLDLMEEEFTTFGTAEIMLSNIDFNTAEIEYEKIKEIDGVQSVSFENTPDHYKDSSAYMSITFDGELLDDISISAMEEIRNLIAPYDFSVKTLVGVNNGETLGAEMSAIMVVALCIIIVVLLFTAKSYAELPVFLITFGVAALLNRGTNYLFGTISFISNSVSIILQLALAIDYAIILSHRFAEEREHYDSKEACVVALSKAIIEISSSSLTTICGLLALSFMNYKIGSDLSMVLIKSIIISLLCVFTVMPGLLVLFSKLIDKTKHKDFVPSIAKIARASIKGRYVILPIFSIIAIGGMIISSQATYLYSANNVRVARVSERVQQEDRISEKFGTNNILALIVPSGSYEKEAQLLAHLETFEEVETAIGLANTEAIDDYMLTDYVTARALSEILELDYELARLLYSSYAINDEDYAKIVNSDPDNYTLPLIDVILFASDMVDDGYVDLDEELIADLQEISESIKNGQKQLESENYSRMLISLNIAEEGDETFVFLEELRNTISTYYDEVYLVGNATSNEDIANTFTQDNLLISILSALFVIIVLLFTFGSVGVPVFLIIVIQSAIFINFSIPHLQGISLFFIGYLVVSAIQMGANVDYAIVITNRYNTLRKTMKSNDAIVQALDESFATVLTSGTILSSAGMAIQFITTDGSIATIGQCIGRGTIISMILVLFVLPSLLYVGTAIIDKTSFTMEDIFEDIQPINTDNALEENKINEQNNQELQIFLEDKNNEQNA